jgi:S1-C subfamily serine protease
MKLKLTRIGFTILLASLLLSACGTPNLSALLPGSKNLVASTAPRASNPEKKEQAQHAAPQSTPGGTTNSLSGYESALEGIYTQVNPSVVSIRVVSKAASSGADAGNSFSFPGIPGLPNFFGSPNQGQDQPAAPQYSQALGSGFVWNKDGYIVTNNHVVSGADKIEVKFADGTSLPASLVGADPNSDLAVVKVENPGFELSPITISDTPAKVGQIAVAIGNPFGLENTMTVGIVSALGRTLPATEGSSTVGGGSYSIPDIIQTDASINPGNSGGPLVDDQGALIGVNSAIASPVRANSGVGFAIPATIVSQVVPELIKNGKYEHPYLGIGGLSLTPDLAKSMNLAVTQRGALVKEVVANGPADKAGLKGSSKTVSIDGQDVKVGGDLITAIDSSPVKTIEDVIAYLAMHTSVGQKVTLTFLRDGKEQTADVTLEARPAATDTKQTVQNNNQSNGAWLGIAGQPLTAEIAKEMNLPETQSGILVEQVQAGSPADKAGLQGSFKPVLINGQRVLVGGDILTAIDGQTLNTLDDLKSYVQNAKPGQEVKLTILRDGKEQTLTATLEAHP